VDTLNEAANLPHTLSKLDELELTRSQAREFLEERRGLYSLSDHEIQAFCQSIYAFEHSLVSAF
jgi:hypothetical protein